MGTVTVKWYVDGCGDPDDPNETETSKHSDRELLIGTIAEKWWHRSGDYSPAFDLVVVSPSQFVGRYPVKVESVPHFRVGKPS